MPKTLDFITQSCYTTSMTEADAKRLSYVGVKPGPKTAQRDSDSWYTPQRYLDSARVVLGAIALDPFSSARANETVGARSYYTEQDNALTRDWIIDGPEQHKTVWMNPPYGRAMTAACTKFIEQWLAGRFSAGIILCNNSTDTKWWTLLSKHATAFCFTDHRIQFCSPDGKNTSSNTRGQVFIYYGADASAFITEFSKHGLIMIKPQEIKHDN